MQLELVHDIEEAAQAALAGGEGQQLTQRDPARHTGKLRQPPPDRLIEESLPSSTRVISKAAVIHLDADTTGSCAVRLIAPTSTR